MKKQSDINADRRRAGLRALMQAKSINPTTLAQMSGLTSPNALFNFLHGRTQSLSLDLIEPILRAFPDVSFRELTGLKPGSSGNRHDAGGAPTPPVFVSVETSGGVWQPKFELPADQWTALAVPDHVAANTAGLFGVRVRTPGADMLYPDGTVLICRRLGRGHPAPQAGCRYVVQERRAQRFRVTVQEARIFEGQMWLWPRSSHPKLQTPTLFAEEQVASAAEDKRPAISLKGLVVGSWQPDALSSHP
jgi:hypothetical protein